MRTNPEIVVTDDGITITLNGATITLTADEWSGITRTIEHQSTSSGQLGQLYRHPVTPAKWASK